MWFELFPSLEHLFAFGSFFNLARFLGISLVFEGVATIFIYLPPVLIIFIFWVLRMINTIKVKSAFWRCSLYFVGVFSTSALCVVPSIIRAYFVAVFQTARHIINVVGARPHSQLQSAAWQITQKHKMKQKHR